MSMLMIRKIHDGVFPRDQRAIAQAMDLLRAQFPAVRAEDIDSMSEKFLNPFKYKLRTILLVAESSAGVVRGMALIQHDPGLRFVFLDFISTLPGKGGGGLGGALYARVREEAQALGAHGVFFECLPDDEALCPDPVRRAENAARLRFYERFGARPIAGTGYETPLSPTDTEPPFLCYDDLGEGQPLRRDAARRFVRALLEGKYGYLCSPAYNAQVIASFCDDPIQLRPPRYVTPEEVAPLIAAVPEDQRVALVVNEGHEIHHVRERGYVESPVRVSAIMGALTRSGLFHVVETQHYPRKHITAVHDPAFVKFLEAVCDKLDPGQPVYPYVFPIRNRARQPDDVALRAGYYCIDTFTPLDRNAWRAARGAVDAALTAADQLVEGRRFAYALVRPPGHHAERASFGGFCYLNANAIAAHHLSRYGKVAILDLDYHHGNGQQDIFYSRGDVLTISIHGHPRFAYPYFTGFADERGEGEGLGKNINYPLPEEVDGPKYREVLEHALEKVLKFGAVSLVIALGLDTTRLDPTGSWSLVAKDIAENGRMVARLGLRTLVIQEGGYRTRTLGKNAAAFFEGLMSARDGAPLRKMRARPQPKPALPKDPDPSTP